MRQGGEKGKGLTGLYHLVVQTSRAACGRQNSAGTARPMQIAPHKLSRRRAMLALPGGGDKKRGS